MKPDEETHCLRCEEKNTVGPVLYQQTGPVNLCWECRLAFRTLLESFLREKGYGRITKESIRAKP
jgi:hypothetical protein